MFRLLFLLCTLVIAVAIGICLYYGFAAGIFDAILTGFCAFLLMLIMRMRLHYGRLSSNFDVQIHDLGRLISLYTNKISNLKLDFEEHSMSASLEDKQRLAVIESDIATLGKVVRQLAEAVADIEVDQLNALSAPATQTQQSKVRNVNVASDKNIQSEGAPIKESKTDLGLFENNLEPNNENLEETIDNAISFEKGRDLEEISNSIDNLRIEPYLQPIVTIPQRHVQDYEVLARVVNSEGQVIEAKDFLLQARTTGRILTLDKFMLEKSIQIIRHLSSKNKNIHLFVNVSGSSLNDESTWRYFLSVLEANKAIAESLILELRHKEFIKFGVLEMEAMNAAADLGYRFSVDNISKIGSSLEDWSKGWVRYIKVDANRLFSSDSSKFSSIHPEDLANYARRYGITLIATHLETERQVVELLEYGVGYGQGYLFSKPRPVKADVFGEKAPDTFAQAIG